MVYGGIAILLLVILLAATGRLGLSMADLLEPEPVDHEWMISAPGDTEISFTEALRSHGSARRGE